MSDIRKIQTGNNQYTLHARVSDKLAIMCSSKTRNNTNYPFHRILKTDVYSNNAWVNHGITLYLSGHYASPSVRFGIIDIEFSQNGTSNSAAKITWIVRSGFEIDDVQAGLFAPASGTYIDVYLKARTAYDGVAVKCISEGDWTVDNQTYKFVNSEEVNNTTASNKLTSYEVYKTIEEAATQLHGKAYTSIIKPTDSGTVANAGYAEKIGTNKSHPQIGSSTKPVYIDNTGQVRACSRDIPTGMTIDTVLNDTSVNAVQNKVINAALKGKNPKAKADFIASSDLPALPITAGVLDLNGYTLTLSGTTQLTGTLTIKNGTIGGEGIISSEDAVFYIYDCQLSDSAKISISCIMFVTDNLYYSHVLNEEIWITMPTLSLNNKTVAWISNSSCIRIKGQLTSADDFGVSSIINSTYILIQNIAINIKTSNTIFLSGIICTQIDSCSNINMCGNVPEFGIYQIDQNSIIKISNCIFDDGTNTSLMMEGAYDAQNHRYYQFGYVDNIEAYYNNNFYGLPTAKAVLDYLKNYAKKSDISAVYKYKGTKTNYSELTTSGNNTGDVWNITNADTANHIKAGDNVVWDGSKWDNLSGTVDLSNYLQKGGKQTTTSTADGGSNVYTFKDGSTITVKNGSKGSTGDAADIPKLAKGVAGIVPGTTDDNLNASRWLNGGDNGIGKWSPLPIAGGGTTGIVRTCKDYTGSINRDDIHGYAHGTTPPTLQPITSGASDYRGVESDGSGRLFVNVPAYEKNINRAQNTVLAAPTTGTGTATFRKLTTSDIPWSDKLKVVTESQFNSTAPTAGVFYFVLEE